MERDVRRCLEVPVVLVFHVHSRSVAIGVSNFKIRAYREQMSSIADLDVVPRHFFPAIGKPESSGESGGFFIELDYVSAFAVDVLDKDVSGPRGIVSLVFHGEGAEASVRRRAESIFQQPLFAYFLVPLVLDRSWALRVKDRFDFRAETAVPLKAGKRLKRLFPWLAIFADARPHRAASLERDLGFDGVQHAPLL